MFIYNIHVANPHLFGISSRDKNKSRTTVFILSSFNDLSLIINWITRDGYNNKRTKELFSSLPFIVKIQLPTEMLMF